MTTYSTTAARPKTTTDAFNHIASSSGTENKSRRPLARATSASVAPSSSIKHGGGQFLNNFNANNAFLLRLSLNQFGNNNNNDAKTKNNNNNLDLKKSSHKKSVKTKNINKRNNINSSIKIINN